MGKRVSWRQGAALGETDVYEGALTFALLSFLAWSRDYTLIYQIFHFTPTMEDKVVAILASTLGMLCFAGFALRAGGAPMRFAEDRALTEERRRLSQVFIWTLAVCGPPAIYSLSRNYGADSVYDGLTMDRATGVAINTKNIGYITDLQLMAVSLSALVVWLARFRWWSFVPLVIFGILRAGTGGRGACSTFMKNACVIPAYVWSSRVPPS